MSYLYKSMVMYYYKSIMLHHFKFLMLNNDKSFLKIVVNRVKMA
jgi:hypothetical protein